MGEAGHDSPASPLLVTMPLMATATPAPATFRPDDTTFGGRRLLLTAMVATATLTGFFLGRRRKEKTPNSLRPLTHNRLLFWSNQFGPSTSNQILTYNSKIVQMVGLKR
jgi:hypothetical protein